jgi:hypothetical protein
VRNDKAHPRLWWAGNMLRCVCCGASTTLETQALKANEALGASGGCDEKLAASRGNRDETPFSTKYITMHK